MNLLFIQRHNWSQKFWCKVVKNWQKFVQNHWHYIRYITIKKIDDYESICSVNRLYLHINHVSGCIDKNENKYLIFDSVDENKEVLKKYANVWDGIKNKIKAINGGEENDYGKD